MHLSVGAGQGASNIFRDLIDRFPELKHHKLLFAINETYAKGDEIIHDGDELAIFTAVSGG
jgi:molybdopterin converting factor small subunit